MAGRGDSSGFGSSPVAAGYLGSHALAGTSPLSSRYGSGADLALREQRLEGGSVYDGWSDAEELAGLVAGAAPAPAPAAEEEPGAAATPAERSAGAAGGLSVSAAVQTAAWEPGAEEGAALEGGPGSPESPYVVAEGACFFDDATAGAATSEFECVAGQRDSGTQTLPPQALAQQPHPPGPAARLAAAGLPGAGRCVTPNTRLAELMPSWQAGCRQLPLHTRQAGAGGQQPFGPSFLRVLCRGAVAEVLASGHIATITLYQPCT